MSDHHKHPPSKKELIRARNKHTLTVNQLAELANNTKPVEGSQATGHDIAQAISQPISHSIAAPVFTPNSEPPPKTAMGTATRTRLDLIRNKISGRKRVAKDRWNRFAGTSGGGGRGL